MVVHRTTIYKKTISVFHVSMEDLSGWNHRIIRFPLGKGYGFAVHEVFYNTDGTIDAWTEDAVSAYGETPEELEEDLARMKEALSLPFFEIVVENGEETLREIQ